MKRTAIRVAGVALVGGAVSFGATPAFGHGIVTIRDSTLAFRATDFVSRNTITVTQTSQTITLLDSTGFGGLDPGDCRPGRVDLETGYVIEAVCKRAGIGALRINVGEREDEVTVRSDLPTHVIGGGGIDTITTGNGDDRIDGGEGDDIIDGGGGTDTIDGGPGNDAITANDGNPDHVTCGPGLDATQSDAFDVLGADCEHAPISALSQDADDAAPSLTVRNTRRQSATTHFSIRAASNEPAKFVAQSAIVIGPDDYPLRPGRGELTTAVGAVDLRPQMSAATKRIVLRALHKHRPVRLFVSVVATDATGNSSLANAKTITVTP